MDHAMDFSRCFLKTRFLDFATIPHGGGDCTTHKKTGEMLGMKGEVARNEGRDVFAVKGGECDQDNGPNCAPEDPKTMSLEKCQMHCAMLDACNSFAWCSGEGRETPFPRCYFKTADFATIRHQEKFPDSPGDCNTYYRGKAGNCGGVKAFFKKQECCGMPGKELNNNIMPDFFSIEVNFHLPTTFRLKAEIFVPDCSAPKVHEMEMERTYGVCARPSETYPPTIFSCVDGKIQEKRYHDSECTEEWLTFSIEDGVCVGYANADATANDHMLLTILDGHCP